MKERLYCPKCKHIVTIRTTVHGDWELSYCSDCAKLISG